VVFGVGAVGGYFGGRLAHHVQNTTPSAVDLVFIARGDTLRTIQSEGLRVTHNNETLKVNVKCTDDTAAVGVVDVVLVCVKDQHLNAAIPQMRPLLGPATVVIPLLNGVGCAIQLAKELGDAAVVGGYCIVIGVAAQGAIQVHAPAVPTMNIGRLAKTGSIQVEKMNQFAELVNGSKEAKVIIEEDIAAGMWNKLLFVGSFSGVCALARAPLGVLGQVPESLNLIRKVMEDIYATARAQNVNLPENTVDKNMQLVSTVIKNTPATTGSMARDILNGKESELTAQYGDTIKIAKDSGVPVPSLEFVYYSLLPQELKARGKLNFKL